jgi:hypothetical protein
MPFVVSVSVTMSMSLSMVMSICKKLEHEPGNRDINISIKMNNEQ